MYVDREPSAGPAGAGQAYTASRSLNIGRAAFCRLALSVSASRYIGMAEETDGVDAAAGSAGILPAVGPAGRPARWGAGGPGRGVGRRAALRRVSLEWRSISPRYSVRSARR